jgi:hypothetical protein
MVQTHIDRDAVQPGCERRLSLEPAEAAIGSNEHVLREVARVLVVADEPVTEQINLALVALHDRTERVARPGQARGDQFPVVSPGQVPMKGLVRVRRAARHARLSARRGRRGPHRFDCAVDSHSSS